MTKDYDRVRLSNEELEEVARKPEWERLDILALVSAGKKAVLGGVAEKKEAAELARRKSETGHALPSNVRAGSFTSHSAPKD